jgi:hypothetical protein
MRQKSVVPDDWNLNAICLPCLNCGCERNGRLVVDKRVTLESRPIRPQVGGALVDVGRVTGGFRPGVVVPSHPSLEVAVQGAVGCRVGGNVQQGHVTRLVHHKPSIAVVLDEAKQGREIHVRPRLSKAEGHARILQY